MAKAVIKDKPFAKLKRIEDKDYSNARLKATKYPKVVKINQVLPFRIKFTNIMIPGYGPNDVPPIGIAIVGYNNYIL